jgi:hypothetical protein
LQHILVPAYFEVISANHILLLRFTIDPFGGLGHQAHVFLYHTKPTKTIKPPNPHPANFMQRSTLGTIHYNQLQAAHQGLLPKATKPTHHHHPIPNTPSAKMGPSPAGPQHIHIPGPSPGKYGNDQLGPLSSVVQTLTDSQAAAGRFQTMLAGLPLKFLL